ncbi:FliI/YscN family ATPase [Buchnera aphidicola]|uniref:Flagellum-specific ATP synthase n=1 Tax=Buchnera aphidicola (Therioaphis trifolii) TaxID=1241884 RepID=A0A4D6YFX4_9GAMM|nr:FliI/YscN family ATPase [Buchnera aphidicola]QCI27063.1 FliI/YscN family ATPase [Buchnera aphidicola (Therioaphis trifolii)]
MNKRLNNWYDQINIFNKKIDDIPNIIYYGHVIGLRGSIIEATGLKLPIHSLCIIEIKKNNQINYIECIVIGFLKEKTFLTSFKDVCFIPPNSFIFSKDIKKHIFQKWPIGFQLLGRVLDGQGKPLDYKPLLNKDWLYTLSGDYINPLNKKPINEIFDVGIRSINALLTLGKGQKIGLCSQSGYGKSILLGMISKYSKADIIVIALIGERGREVQEFLNNSLGLKNLYRSIIIVVPINASPILKIQGSMYAMCIAEYFRDKNKDVLLIFDSLTRYAMSEREISISLGEIPLNQGYPSSIFSKLSNFIERASNSSKDSGSITTFFTILLEYEENDLILEISKSILDGHIILSKLYAESGHYPAIDIELSISRVMFNIISKKNYEKSRYLKQLISVYQKNQDLINIGAYIHGSNKILDEAIEKWNQIICFLKQDIFESSSYLKSISELNKII